MTGQGIMVALLAEYQRRAAQAERDRDETAGPTRETLDREAKEMSISFEDHFTHLVIHGFLHLLGYDHMDDDEALAMEGLETQILASLGVADPYADE